MEFLEEQDDIQKYLDEIFDEESSENDVLTEDQVNYYIGRIKRNKARLDMNKQRAKAILDSYKTKVENWVTKNEMVLTQDNEYCLSKLKTYWEANAKDNKTKLRFPEGSLGFYKKRQTMSVDQEEVVKFLEMIIDKDKANSEEFKSLLTYVPKLDLKKFKEGGKVDENNIFKYGDYAFSGVTVTPSEDVFSVR